MSTDTESYDAGYEDGLAGLSYDPHRAFCGQPSEAEERAYLHGYIEGAQDREFGWQDRYPMEMP